VDGRDHILKERFFWPYGEIRAAWRGRQEYTFTVTSTPTRKQPTCGPCSTISPPQAPEFRTKTLLGENQRRVPLSSRSLNCSNTGVFSGKPPYFDIFVEYRPKRLRKTFSFESPGQSRPRNPPIATSCRNFGLETLLVPGAVTFRPPRPSAKSYLPFPGALARIANIWQ